MRVVHFEILVLSFMYILDMILYMMDDGWFYDVGTICMRWTYAMTCYVWLYMEGMDVMLMYNDTMIMLIWDKTLWHGLVIMIWSWIWYDLIYIYVYGLQYNMYVCNVTMNPECTLITMLNTWTYMDNHTKMNLYD